MTQQKYKKTLLKGGSLAGTYLVESTSEKYVRKEIRTDQHREYGYQRWYSQMKRLQRYQALFPGLFPSILRTGFDDDVAFFDMEFLEGAVNCHDYLCTVQGHKEVAEVLHAVVDCMNRMHSVVLPSSTEALDLYVQEEVRGKIADCLLDEEFKKFYDHETIIFNNEEILSIGSVMNEYLGFGKKNYITPVESFTHGNITLENMMYNPTEKRIYFIDPYDENIIDNIYNEYSQILQSSSSHYELYNHATPVIKGNNVEVNIEIPTGISVFNTMFTEGFMKDTLTSEEIAVTRFFEISQFMRMLPFKLHVDRNKMFLFYALGSKLFHDVRTSI